MGIEGMLKREDFFEILAKTISGYYKSTLNRDVYFGYEKRDGCDEIVINKTLSFISKIPIKRGLYEFLDSEYNIRTSIVKYILGKIAVRIICLFPSIGKVKTAYISKDILGKNEFINPQNRSIRIFDYDKLTVDCIVKDGFTDRYFQNQLNFRKHYHFDFMLPLLAYGKNWYREPILRGNPLARVTNKDDYENGLSTVYTYLEQLISGSREEQRLGDYALSLINHIQTLLLQAEGRKKIKYAGEIRILLADCKKIIMSADIPVATAVSHGDLQSGNIWVDRDKKTWIYDWETVGRRSVWYDASVLGYSLRRPLGWSELAGTLDYSYLLKYDTKKDYTLHEIQAIIHVVLLEDIQFYLEDMLELPKDWGNWIFDNYCERILPLFKK